jgi:ATP adenylyltransferase
VNALLEQAGDASLVAKSIELATPAGTPVTLAAGRSRRAGVMSAQRLWAPWRMQYVQGERKDEGCIFCLAGESSDDEARLVLHRGQRCLVMLNAFPYNSGHLMVSPHRHVASIERLDDDELLELMTLTQRALRAVRETYAPDGFNLGVNEGEVAGAGFAGHVHLHVVPRWAADSNFMAVTAYTRVLPQSLEDSYAQLRERFARLQS